MTAEHEYVHEDTVTVQCPHCKKGFLYHYNGVGTIEVEPPEREEDDR